MPRPLICASILVNYRNQLLGSAKSNTQSFLGGTLKKKLAFMAILASTALLISGCSSSSESAGAKACLALDTGGVDDKSFNASAWAGAQAAAEENSDIEVKYLAAATDADYAPNIKKLVDEGCTTIIGVGFLINGAII